MSIYLYPTNREFSEINPALVARHTAGRVGFDIMPFRDVNAAIIQWEQKDNYFGLQQLRGLDGAPQHVNRPGLKTYAYTPGVYGEFIPVSETELTMRAGNVLSNTPVDLSDIVMDANDQLLVRELDRMESINWSLLTTGTFSISMPNGAVGFTDTFTLQTASRAVVWSSTTTATPLADLRTVQLLSRGVGASFGAGATAYLNRKSANFLLANTTATDLGGKLVIQGNTLTNSIPQINQVAMGQDLPSFVIYDEGYYDNSNVWVPFIPDGKVVIVGKRNDGSKIGEYVKTRHVINGGGTGSWSVVTNTSTGQNAQIEVPPKVTVYRGHNGGPVIYFPSSIVILTIN